MDSNRDNVYRFTLEATDSFGAKVTTLVAVTVTDGGEELAIASTLARSVKENATAGTKVGDPIEPSNPGDSSGLTYSLADASSDSRHSTYFDINRATGQITAKKPLNFEADDQCGDPNACVVTVTVTDSSGVDAAVTSAVTITVTDVNEAPEYTQTATRYVVENTADDKELGNPVVANDDGNTVMAEDDPVVATDPESGASPADRLLYTLGGPDAMYFAIYRASGQVITRELLNYEALPADDKTYEVTVTGTDRKGLSDTINLTIEVVDVPEAPEIITGLSVSGSAAENYAEKDTDAVATYEAGGDNAANASWTLEGADDGAFVLEGNGMSRMLMFMTAPNFEMPTDNGMDNGYMVTVKVDDGSGTEEGMDTQDVMVTVTNQDDDGMVTFWRNSADATTAAIVVGDELTAAVMDPDGKPGDTPPIAADTLITRATWQWAKHAMPSDGSMPADDSTDWMDIGTNAAYTVVAADEDYYLRAMAMYDDGESTGKMAMEMTASAVVAEAPPMTLLERYDTDKSGRIDKDELADAIYDYEINQTISN